MTEESTTRDLERIAHEIIEAVNRGDIDAAMAGFRPDAVWDSTAIGLGTREGVAAIRLHVEDWMRSYEHLEIVMEEFCDLGNGVTFSVHLLKGRPVSSTGYVQLRDAVVAVSAGAMIEQFTTYLDIDEARAAAEGLAQERG
jgi:ketosteroid isomerase-like protein